jgi:tetratricopeptide (TPR) repeat protein
MPEYDLDGDLRRSLRALIRDVFDPDDLNLAYQDEFSKPLYNLVQPKAHEALVDELITKLYHRGLLIKLVAALAEKRKENKLAYEQFARIKDQLVQSPVKVPLTSINSQERFDRTGSGPVPAAPNYRDFELEISGRHPEYFGKVINSPSGPSTRCRLKFKFAENPKDFEILRLKIENVILRGDDDAAFRGPASRSERILRDFGRELFRTIFVEAGPIRDVYAQSKGAVSTNGHTGLRLKLRIDPPELSCLPWEYLYDEDDTPNFISLLRPVVRSLDTSDTLPQIRVNGPLRILGMIVNSGTAEWPRLDEAAERRRIAAGIDRLQRDGRIIFEWVSGGTGTDLLNKLIESEWHVFHFIGHGGVEELLSDDMRPENAGFIVLVDEYGHPVKKFASDLSVLLSTPHRSLQLAVLNCCDSGKTQAHDGFESPAVALVRAGIPAVVAMQFPIRDKSAVRLAEGFYNSLANNHPVDAAVTMARRFIRNDSKTDWAIPVLYMSAADGKIFELANPEPKPTRSGAVDTETTPEDLREFERLNDASQKSTDDLERLASLGRRLVDLKKVEPPTVARAYYDLGRAQLGQNNVQNASVSLSSAIEMDPNRAEYRIRRSNLFARVGLYEKALLDIAEAIKLEPFNAEHYWVKGIVCGMVASSSENPSTLSDAISAFGTAIKLNKTEVKFLVSRANALAQAKHYAESLADIDHAISLTPENANLQDMRARVEVQVARGP